MIDSPNTRSTSSTGLALTGFALGAVVGAGLALLLAPASGERTRERIASAAQRLNQDARRTIGEARDTVAELGTDAKSALRAGQDAFTHDRATRESRNHRRPLHAVQTAPSPDALMGPDEEDSR